MTLRSRWLASVTNLRKNHVNHCLADWFLFLVGQLIKIFSFSLNLESDHLLVLGWLVRWFHAGGCSRWNCYYWRRPVCNRARVRWRSRRRLPTRRFVGCRPGWNTAAPVPRPGWAPSSIAGRRPGGPNNAGCAILRDPSWRVPCDSLNVPLRRAIPARLSLSLFLSSSLVRSPPSEPDRLSTSALRPPPKPEVIGHPALICLTNSRKMILSQSIM